MSLANVFEKNLNHIHKQLMIVSPELKNINQMESKYEKITPIPFWCFNQTKHITNPDGYHLDFCCLTHVVGLPQHGATGEELPLTPYQIEFFEEIIKAKTAKKGQSVLDAMKDSHKFHVLKGRQMGFTEIVLRIIQYFCFHGYAGWKVGIIAATNGNLARKDLRRFRRLFRNIPWAIQEWKGNYISLTNGTSVEAFPATEEAITGDTDYKCVFMDESAKWKNVDDTSVFNSIVPLVNNNGADFFLVSTPKHPVKMFYKIWKNPGDYVMLEYNIWRAEGNLLTKEKIQEMIDNAKEDPNQEYLCKFSFGKDAILGFVDDSLRTKNEYEWDSIEQDIIEWESEDDGYIENDNVKDEYDKETKKERNQRRQKEVKESKKKK